MATAIGVAAGLGSATSEFERLVLERLEQLGKECFNVRAHVTPRGGYVEVRAADEELVEVRGRDAAAFARIAWHLGNRHLPVQLLGDRIRIRHDHVIAEMVEGLGGHVDDIEAPFDPEPGAYAQSAVIGGATMLGALGASVFAGEALAKARAFYDG